MWMKEHADREQTPGLETLLETGLQSGLNIIDEFLSRASRHRAENPALQVVVARENITDTNFCIVNKVRSRSVFLRSFRSNVRSVKIP